MIIEKPIIGKHVIMRSVECGDAEFILKLRLDESIRKFISPTENNVEKQIQWIQEQREREGDYYFLYTDLNGENLGVISVYNVKDGTGETGRQMSFGGSIHNMEAEYLLMCFAFETLKLNKTTSTAYLMNKKAISKARKLGIRLDKIIQVNGKDSYYTEITVADFYCTWKLRMESYLAKVENLEL
nr:GNAT family N-acetyltransferase [Odoribacter splanchnicus]